LSTGAGVILPHLPCLIEGFPAECCERGLVGIASKMRRDVFRKRLAGRVTEASGLFLTQLSPSGLIKGDSRSESVKGSAVTAHEI